MVKIVELTSNEQQLEQVSALYQEVWKSDDSIKERIQKHSSYKGFNGFIILSKEDHVLGYSYGYMSLPGQFYHELLASELNPEEYYKWLKDCFEFVELAVHPSNRNQGLGKFLITKLLRKVGNRTAILTTQVDNTSARSLYESLDWKIIKYFYPDRSKQPYVIMGKEL